MTNILALSGVDKKGNDETPFLVFCADGMTSAVNNGTKEDFNRKLYKIGQSFIMGTGYRGDSLSVINYLKSNNFSGTPDDMAEEVIRYCERASIRGRTFNMIVGGRNKDGSLGIRHMNASGYIRGKKKPIRGYGDFTSTGVYDGSATPFVASLIDVGKSLGIYTDTTSYANAIVSAYEFGRRGAVSSTVNSELQYGILTKDRAVTIMSPNISINGEEFAEYVKDLIGIEVKVPKDTKDEAAMKVYLDQRIENAVLIGEFYNSLDSKLSLFSDLRRTYNQYAHEFGEGRCSQDMLEFMLSKLKKEREIVQGTIESLVSGDPKQFVESRRQYAALVESYEKNQLGI